MFRIATLLSRIGLLGIIAAQVLAHENVMPETNQKSNDCVKLLNNAEQFISLKKYHLALRDVKCAYELEPTDERCFVLFSQIYHQQKNYNEALKWQNKFIEKNPTHSFILNQHCDTLLALGNYDDAIKLLDNLIAHDFSPDLILKRVSLSESRDGQATLCWLKDIQKVRPLAMIDNEILRLLIAQHNYDEACLQLDQMIAKAPRQEFLLTQKASLLERIGKHNQAVFTAALAKKKIDALPLNLKNTTAIAALRESLTSISHDP